LGSNEAPAIFMARGSNTLHNWFGRHAADLKISRWDAGSFVSSCTVCGEQMIKVPGAGWQLRSG
jgi:hypothetical protein